MQVNRLSHLIFPPGTPQVGNGSADAAKPEAQKANRGAVPAPRDMAPPAATALPVPAAEVVASVQVDLAHGQRAQASVTYGPDGMFAGKSSVELARTPAERFVASAVDIMREFNPESAAPAAQYGALNSLKQVFSRFSARA